MGLTKGFVDVDRDVVAGGIASICLVQAVRSFLHFSQLSAWLNKSSGSRPQQLLYRVTMPGQAFTSKFVATPIEHHFPVACVPTQLSNHAIKVFAHYHGPHLYAFLAFIEFIGPDDKLNIVR